MVCGLTASRCAMACCDSPLPSRSLARSRPGRAPPTPLPQLQTISTARRTESSEAIVPSPLSTLRVVAHESPARRASAAIDKAETSGGPGISDIIEVSKTGADAPDFYITSRACQFHGPRGPLFSVSEAGSKSSSLSCASNLFWVLVRISRRPASITTGSGGILPVLTRAGGRAHMPISAG